MMRRSMIIVMIVLLVVTSLPCFAVENKTQSKRVLMSGSLRPFTSSTKISQATISKKPIAVIKKVQSARSVTFGSWTLAKKAMNLSSKTPRNTSVQLQKTTPTLIKPQKFPAAPAVQVSKAPVTPGISAREYAALKSKADACVASEESNRLVYERDMKMINAEWIKAGHHPGAETNVPALKRMAEYFHQKGLCDQIQVKEYGARTGLPTSGSGWHLSGFSNGMPEYAESY